MPFIFCTKHNLNIPLLMPRRRIYNRSNFSCLVPTYPVAPLEFRGFCFPSAARLLWGYWQTRATLTNHNETSPGVSSHTKAAADCLGYGDRSYDNQTSYSLNRLFRPLCGKWHHLAETTRQPRLNHPIGTKENALS